jgi:hypothetical protein
MARDEQDTAEAIDDDKLDDATPGDVDRAPTDELRYPPDRAVGVNDPGADDRIVDSVISRQDRTIPDPIEEIGRDSLEGPEDDLDAPAEDAAYGSDAFDDVGSPVGRLREPGAEDDGVFPVDEEKDLVATEVGGGFGSDNTDPDGPYSSDLSAEEAAMHLER